MPAVPDQGGRRRKWAKGPKSIAHKGVLTFKNRADKNHFLEISKLKKGKTIADFEAWIKSRVRRRSAARRVRMSLDTGVVRPGASRRSATSCPRASTYGLLLA